MDFPSDGDATHRPEHWQRFRPVVDDNLADWLGKVDRDLQKANSPLLLAGALPDGYSVWEARPVPDRQLYIYGNPRHIVYSSKVKWVRHLLWLAKGRSGRCDCVVCTGREGDPPYLGSYYDPRPRSGDNPSGRRSLRQKLEREHAHEPYAPHRAQRPAESHPLLHAPVEKTSSGTSTPRAYDGGGGGGEGAASQTGQVKKEENPGSFSSIIALVERK